jgi:uncharacterized cupredoxin-like copper-binding protein
MKISLRNSGVMMGFAAMNLLMVLFWLHSGTVIAQESGQVKIVIRNSTFEFHGGILRPDEPATLILQNQDEIQHGFASSLFEGLQVQVETEGVITYGRGIKGVYIDPGETVRFHFIPTRPGKFSFQCDLHPAMKGELLLLTVGVI